jgi:hypothetical protein
VLIRFLHILAGGIGDGRSEFIGAAQSILGNVIAAISHLLTKQFLLCYSHSKLTGIMSLKIKMRISVSNKVIDA